ncbi:MAG: L,D-transpeptidase/peptidoglycan binding protein [Actinobacteria bacterium]|nr:L,D-transpeptidase/peptidoglycan binding protein [Actinomycetota bacterium]
MDHNRAHAVTGVNVVAEEGEVSAAHLPGENQAEVVAFEAEGVVEVVRPMEEVPVEVETDAMVLAQEDPSTTAGGSASSDVVPAPKRHRFRPRLPRLGRKVVVGVTILFLLAFSGVAYATYDYDQAYDGKLLPGVVIAGVDVGGLTPEEAFAAVDAAGKIQLDRNIKVRYEDKSWIVTPRKLGAKSNARDLVDSAVAASERTGVLDKVGMALFGDQLDHERDLAITYPRQGIKGFIEGVASNVDRDPVNAGVDYSSGWLEFTKPKEGRTVLRKQSQRALLRGLKQESDRVLLAVKETKPEITENRYETALLLRIGENKLYLYQDGKITHEYVVATGQPEYPTPTGEYYVTEKRYMPTWVNPDPEGWGASMPLSIPPGPGNPLGTRALNWNASGIRFHGTEATYSLGYNASHGCVRMAMSDVEELYELVEVGTPIVSLVASSLDPMYEESPDPIPVAEDAN